MDTTPPTVLSKFPAENQVNVGRDTKLSITFSEPILPASVNLNTVLLRRGGAGDVQRSFEWDATGKTLFVRPTTLLGSDTVNYQYKVELTEGITDLVGNRLQPSQWYFTTGPLIDFEAPRWRCSAQVTAVPLRFDTVDVSWASQSPTPCSPVSASPATDNVTPSDRLTYVVEYKRLSDASFSSSKPVTGASNFTITGLRANTEYEFRVSVADLAGNKGEFRSAASPVTPPAGRLYVTNTLGNTLSNLADIGQAVGDQFAAVVSADLTGLGGPVGVYVDANAPVPVVYVANFGSNSISAYALSYPEDGTLLGQYPVRNNQAPLWTIQGDWSASDITELSGPTWLWLDAKTDATTGKRVKTLLYVANTLPAAGRTGPVGNSIVVFDVTNTPSSSNSAPIGVIKSQAFRTPIAFAVGPDPADPAKKFLYVVNRDHATYNDNLGGKVLVFPFSNELLDLSNNADNTPVRTFWGLGATGGPCIVTDPSGGVCGPSALALDSTGQTLYVVNRGRNNLLIFANVDQQTTQGSQTPVVVEGPQSGLENARPTSLFFERDQLNGDRLYVTTDREQSLIIFKVLDLASGGDIRPVRIIKGSRTMLGQPGTDTSPQSAGPSGVMVVANEAYVVTPGFWVLTPIPSLSVFDVSPGQDPVVTSTSPSVVTSTPPARLVVNPLLGASGMVLDREHNRLYVSSFHANMVLVYEGADTLGTGQRNPNRIIAGPKTGLNHPVSLVFRPATATRTAALYVVNQSSHSILVFGGEPLATGRDVADLSGDVFYSRYLGPPESMDPFSVFNATELVYPAGIAIDENLDLLYVSNRDAVTAQDFAGRRILAFKNASTIGATPCERGDLSDDLICAGVTVYAGAGNVEPAWKIEGDPPPPRGHATTDLTTLKRPSALLVDADLDRLFVANRQGPSILVFDGISRKVQEAPANHNLAPTWTILHSALTNPAGLALNLVLNELYVTDARSNEILAFDVSRLDPAAPVPALEPRVIAGSSTGLATPIGVALDPDK
ncbi:MAG: Ig-like domain-containing protein [Nitrospirae bacterium]|nr:Ig-like domain-containing protein [Nitrospirota bacterium]